jgi:hypothetical protein
MVKVPVAVGVPESAQLPKLTPGGNPPLTEKLYGGTPPEQAKLEFTGLPSGTVIEPPDMLSGAGLIVTVKSFASEVFAASETVTVNEYLPAVVGVPVSSPLLWKLKPGGTFPLESENPIGETPPIAPTVPEYPTPTVPSGSAAKGEMRTGGIRICSGSALVASVPALSVTMNVME